MISRVFLRGFQLWDAFGVLNVALFTISIRQNILRSGALSTAPFDSKDHLASLLALSCAAAKMALIYSSRLGVAGPSLEESTHITALGRLYGLESLPVEILLDIYRELDVESVYRLALTNTLFHGLLRRNKFQILLPILQKEFAPFDELLQVYTASDEDAQQLGGTFQPRRVIYRRYPGDAVGVVLCRGGLSPLAEGSPGSNGFAQISGDNHRPAATASLPPPRSVALNERDLQLLLKYCRVTRKWEDIYPRLHWMVEPENCRQLHSVEKVKLRRALYRWWLHALYFHGDHPRPRRGEPEPFTHDPRISRTRVYSTSELMELRALSASAKNLIRHYIFPNLEQKLHEVRLPMIFAAHRY